MAAGGLVLCLDTKDQKSSAFRRCLVALAGAQCVISARAASSFPCALARAQGSRCPFLPAGPADNAFGPALPEGTGLRRGGLGLGVGCWVGKDIVCVFVPLWQHFLANGPSNVRLNT